MEGQKVLIIDSDTRIVEMAAIKLSNAGYWVMTGADGTEGYQKLINSPPDLLLINPELPGKNGYEIIAEVRGNPELRRMSIILLADRHFDEEKFKNSRFKIDDILAKPFNPKKLLNLVNTQIINARVLRELNPITLLPGRIHLQGKVTNKIKEGQHFDLIFMDLKDFKVFNQFYGFEKGNEVIRFLANLILEALADIYSAEPELFHLGGDDFCIMLKTGSAEPLCQHLMQCFDRDISQFYLEEDRHRGGLVAANRRGMVEQWPVMTITFGIVSNEQRELDDWLNMELVGNELLQYAKSMPGSRFVRDRRHS